MTSTSSCSPVGKLIGTILYFSIILLFPACSTQPTPETVQKHDLKRAIIEVAKKNIPAVAHIEATMQPEFQNPFAPFENDPFFRHFFNMPPGHSRYYGMIRGLGSGMIIDAEGHILTNYHVVARASKIEVLLADGRRFPASLVGSDQQTDLSVIRISTRARLPYVKFADSGQVTVGQWVVAIGHPRGLDQTVTKGIISARHRRELTESGNYQNYLQTDAAMNPGSSGGPLLNLDGEVIGVNAAISTTSGGFEGISFTIPSNTAKRIARDLIAHGAVERNWFDTNKFFDNLWNWLKPTQRNELPDE